MNTDNFRVFKLVTGEFIAGPTVENFNIAGEVKSYTITSAINFMPTPQGVQVGFAFPFENPKISPNVYQEELRSTAVLFEVTGDLGPIVKAYEGVTSRIDLGTGFTPKLV